MRLTYSDIVPPSNSSSGPFPGSTLGFCFSTPPLTQVPNLKERCEGLQ